MRTHLRVMLDDEIALGPGKADLLEAIRDTGSISAAGKRCTSGKLLNWKKHRLERMSHEQNAVLLHVSNHRNGYAVV